VMLQREARRIRMKNSILKTKIGFDACSAPLPTTL